MCCKGFMKKVVPFTLTFLLGILITGLFSYFFMSVSVSNNDVKEMRFNNQKVERTNDETRKNSCRYRMKRVERQER